MGEEHKVEYKFTGSVGSLQKAVEAAIGLLDKYQKKMDSMSEAATAPAQKISKKLQEPLKQVMTEVDQLQKKFKELQNIKMFQNSSVATQMTAAMRNLQQQLTTFQNKSKITAADVKELANAVRNTKQSFAEAGPQIDNIVQKEQKFQEVLASIRERSNAMAEAMRNAFGKMSSPLDGVASKLEAFKAKAAEVMDHVSRMAEAAGSGFRQFKGDAEAAGDAGKAAAAGEQAAGDAAAAIDPKLAIAIKAFQVLKKVVETVPKVFKTAKKAFGTFKNALDSLSSKVQSSTGILKQFTLLLGGVGVGRALSEATKSAIGYIENLNLFTVAMGDSIDEAQRFIDRMTEIYGMDPSNLYRYSGYFYQLTDAIGATSKASKIMSLSLTKAANDISSLFNVEIETVVNNLASGMQGMSRAVRKYGIDIRQTTLQQTALAYGFTEQVSTTSEANRQALRYLTIMNQVKNATKQVTSTVDGATVTMGDFARNIETPANQLRILKEQASQVARAFGNFFIPIMEKTLYVVNGVLMAIKTLLTFLASLAGIDIGGFGGEVSKGADEATGAVGSIGDAADKTAKKLKNLIAPFDELTILSEPKDTGGGGGGAGGLVDMGLDPGLEAALEAMSLDLDEIRMKALDVRDKILDLLGLEFDGAEITVTIGGFIDDLIHLWDTADYTGFGERIAEFLNQGIEWGIQHTDPAKYGPLLNQKVSVLAQVLNGIVKGLNWEGLGTIIGNGVTLALGVLNTFLTTFKFDQLGEKLALGLKGIIDAVNWELLGETLGNLFMAKVRLLSAFFDKFEWATLGTNLGNGFMKLLDTIKWDEMGQKVANLWNGIIDGIRAFWSTYEWGTLGSDLAKYFNTAVREINWHNLGAAVSETLRGLLREVTNFLGELDWFSIGKAIMEFILAIDWLGLLEDVVVAVITILGAVVRGLLGMIVGIFTGIGDDICEGFEDGILEGLKNIGQWLYDHLVEPVVRAVKGFFGIHSPSTVFADIGENLIQGLINGITSMFTALWNTFTNIINYIKGTFKRDWGSAWNGVKTSFENIFSNLGQLLKTPLNDVISLVNKAISGINKINISIPDWVPVVGGSNLGFNIPKIPALAVGGVVTEPTQALIGDGHYDEAIIPLGNSPQLEDMIDRISKAVSATPRVTAASIADDRERPIVVHVYLDGEEITTRQNRTNRMYGRTQQNI